jgi:LysM repeat protein
MKTAMLARKNVWIAMVALLLLSVLAVQAQETNLLTNGGFDGSFVAVQGEQPRNVATGWTPWNASRTNDMPSYQNTQPKYLASSAANASGIVSRIRTGADAQIYYSFFATHDGGLYQTITGITPGTELRFSVYAYVWSTTFDDPNLSEDPGDVAFRVGIDPTGGTDGLSPNVVYSTPLVAYDAYRQSSVLVKATGTSVTVFIRSSVSQPVQYSYIYLDDAVLASATAAPASNTPTNTPTITPTNTPVPPSSTPLPASSTPIASSATPVAPTNTAQPIVPTATTQPQEATPTSENSGGLVPTATPIGLDATATAFAGGTNPTSAPAQPTATRVPGSNTGGSFQDQFPGTIIHVVRRGDTVFDISNLYGSNIDAIIEANGLNQFGFLNIDQRLVIPVRLVVPPTPTPAPTSVAPTSVPNSGTGGAIVLPDGTSIYVIRAGDTLSTIANRFNTTIGTLTQLNGITNPNLIFSGQRMIVPSATGGPVVVPTTPPQQPQATAVPAPVTSYTVQPGDNLYRISLRFGKSMQAIATANNITNFNRIFAGQVLIIP